MAGIAWETSNQILQDAAYELGLITADVSDFWASTDQNLILLRQLLTRVGRDLLKERNWSHFQKEGTVTTANGTASYDLPADFDRLIDQTYWNRTTPQPGMPINAQIWQYYQANSAGAVTFAAIFRFQDNAVQIYPTPTATETIKFEYISSYWVKESGQSAGNTTRADASTDTILFDSTLVMHALKVAFLRAKGVDSTACEQDYQRRLAHASSGDGAAPLLSLAPGRNAVLVDGRNVPDGSWTVS